MFCNIIVCFIYLHFSHVKYLLSFSGKGVPFDVTKTSVSMNLMYLRSGKVALTLNFHVAKRK